VAKKNKVPAENMPEYLLIMSDMQFNCVHEDQSAIEMIREEYKASGYDLPKVIFWNLNATMGQSPVTINNSGTALVSGFSPAIMQSILKAENVTPISIMLSTVNVPRYEVIV
jgi:hypothetical protein